MLAALLLLIGIVLLALAPAARGNNDQLSLLTGGGFIVTFGLFVLVFTIHISRRGRQAKEQGEEREAHAGRGYATAHPAAAQAHTRWGLAG